ncbi:MAG: Geranylgeranyl diphosphate synthase [Candidatus Heimdallarchaeota archaeon LC_3]|nr:MAG: Geranylgeranyl diphosphate synthase [Candidatus Heimdallarchaeota archaeon LC_3]
MNFEDYIDPEIRNRLLREISEAIDKLPGDEAGISGPRNRIRSYILGGIQGKQLRPILVVMATKLLNATEEQMELAYINASTVELLHNMTLIHDDVVDQAPIRRGRPSYHIEHGEHLALHDGDILHSYALSYITHNPSLRLILEISNMVGRGNGLELEFRLEQKFDFTMDDIINVLRLKTAVVFYGCVALAGAVVEREEVTKPLEPIIEKAGIAFQIQDDILDLAGDEIKFGKQHNWDIQESKRNLFLYFALQKGDKDALREIFSKPVGEKTDEDIKIVHQEFVKVKEDVLALRDKYLEECLDALDSLVEKSPEDVKNLYNFLRELIIYICTREK